MNSVADTSSIRDLLTLAKKNAAAEESNTKGRRLDRSVSYAHPFRKLNSFVERFPGFSCFPSDKISVEDGEMILKGQSRCALRQICPKAPLSTTNVLWNVPRYNLGSLGKRPVTNRLLEAPPSRPN